MGERIVRRRIKGRDGVVRLSKVWYAWVPRPNGKGVHRVSTLCTDKQAALVVATKLERAAVDPGHAAAQAALTHDVLQRYVASRIRVGRSEGTLHHVRTKTGHLLRLLPEFARGITHDVVEGYIDQRLTEGVQRTTIKKELRVLKAALKLAVKNKLFADHPDAIIPELEDDYMPRERWLTPWELVALASELQKEPPGKKGGDPANHAAMVVFIVATGARWSEAQRARPEHHDPAANAITLLSSKTKRITKRTSRVVPLTGVTAGLLRWAMARRLAGDGLMFDGWSNVRRSLRLACKRAGIEPVSPNDLRRTFSKWLRNDGVTPDLIASAMGHTSSRMVEKVYGKIGPEELGTLLRERVRGGLLMAGGGGKTGPIECIAVSDETPEVDANTRTYVVPRDGIEPPTRGFSIRSDCSADHGDSADPPGRLPPNGHTVRGGGDSPRFSARPLVDLALRRSHLLDGSSFGIWLAVTTLESSRLSASVSTGGAR
jgi:integrase